MRVCDTGKLDGPFDGLRPARAAVECLKASLAAEHSAVVALDAARADVRRCLQEARQSGAVTLTAIATSITPPRETVAATIRARKRAAAALACRMYEARKRGRVK